MANVSSIVTKAISADDELTGAARLLAKRSIELAMFYLDHGSPQTQLSLIKALMPAIGRSLNNEGESEDLADMRRQLQELNQRLLSA